MQQAVPISRSKHDQIAIAHAVFGSLAGLVLMPAAILVGRYLRAWPKWKKVHMALNITVLVFVIIALVLGLVTSGTQGARNAVTNVSGDNAHNILGWVVLGLIIAQAVVGIGMPFVKRLQAPSYNYVVFQKERHWIRFAHIVGGLAALALLYAQIYLGYGYWNSTSESGTHVPKSVIILYWILLGLALAAYFLGWAIMEPLGRKKRAREMRDSTSPMEQQKRLVPHAA